jgi:hypothetical protein
MRFFRIVMLAALVVTALVAVGELLFGSLDESTARILGTSGAVAFYSIFAMAGAEAAAPGRPAILRATGIISICASIAALAILAVILWDKSAQHWTGFGKAYFHCTIPAVVFTIVALLGRMPVQPALRWLQIVVSVLVILFGVFADVIWVINERFDETSNRVLGVAGVLAAFGTLALPLVAWRARHAAADASVPARAGVHATCPKCGHGFDVG